MGGGLTHTMLRQRNAVCVSYRAGAGVRPRSGYAITRAMPAVDRRVLRPDYIRRIAPLKNRSSCRAER